ncbi:hypothetical protein [Methyloraptor flagellatus]|uniref:Capsule biosynthesis protein n=1 Tax=Methyloraptor flagellatus TaxID=3162530 RepID=A0AAU7XCD8_9HYPH
MTKNTKLIEIPARGMLAPPSRQLAAIKSINLSLGSILFVFCVVIPTTVSAIYFGFIASNRYVSESQFIVRSLSAKHITGLDAILKTFGLATAQDDAYAIANYVSSRDIVKRLDERVNLRQIYSRPGADFVARFPAPWSSDSFESLYNYFTSRVSAVRDSNTGITTLKVITFRPEDSVTLSKAVLTLSEQLANSMNERAQRDAVQRAEADVERAQTEMLTAQSKITAYRNTTLLLDPNQSSQNVVRLIGELSAELARNLAEISEANINSPSNPALAAMKARSTAIQEQIASERQKLAGSDQGLATKISEYENLIMQREFSERRLTSAINSLEASRQDARRQQVYLELLVQPNVADESTDPRRFRNVLTTGFFSLVLFAMAWALFAGIKEHANG